MNRFYLRTRVAALGLLALAAAVLSTIAFAPALATGAEGITTFSGPSSGAVVTVTNTNAFTGVGLMSAASGSGVSGSAGLFGEGGSRANGVFGHSSGWNAIFGRNDTGGAGVVGASAHWIGVWAESAASCTASVSSLSCANGRAPISSAALVVKGDGGGPLIIAQGSDGVDKLSLDNSGNLIVTGNIITDGAIEHGSGSASCSPTCPVPLTTVHRTTPTSGIGTFTAEQSVPSVDDVGEGRLANGLAYVHIDSAFAAITDPRTGYLVFITPQGDSRGLYVSGKTPAGFVVRENMGGRSNIGFDYRIVAKPAGAQAARLPISQIPTMRSEPAQSMLSVAMPRMSGLRTAR